MTTEQWTVGDISIVKIEETTDWSPLELVTRVLPASTKHEIEAVEWLHPTYLLGGELNALVVHSFLVQTPTHKIVVDTGIGNHKKRILPIFELNTDFLGRFEQVWPREDVDGIVSTHLHIDHVGWNTVLRDGRWEPTFPNARYYFVGAEYEHWKAFVDDPHAPEAYSEFGYSVVDAVAVFADSVQPVVEAGQVSWVDAGQSVVPGISLIATAGHTPGHVAVLIESNGESAVVTGDLLHTQVQVARPEWSPEMDTDPSLSATTRRAFLERFADTPTLVLGTHFGTPAGGYVVRDGDTFRLVPSGI